MKQVCFSSRHMHLKGVQIWFMSILCCFARRQTGQVGLRLGLAGASTCPVLLEFEYVHIASQGTTEGVGERVEYITSIPASLADEMVAPTSSVINESELVGVSVLGRACNPVFVPD